MRPFPVHLRSELDVDALAASESTISIIDDTGRILWVNDAWESFARANGRPDGETLARYFDGIAPALRDFYRGAFAGALETRTVFEHVYECGAPEQLRIFICRALPVGPSALVLEHSLVIEEDPTEDDGELATRLLVDGRIRQCSYCRRVHGGACAWIWVRPWALSPHPEASHVICPICAHFYWGRRFVASRVESEGEQTE